METRTEEIVLFRKFVEITVTPAGTWVGTREGTVRNGPFTRYNVESKSEISVIIIKR